MRRINLGHEKFAAAQRHSSGVRSFAIFMGASATIRRQQWILYRDGGEEDDVEEADYDGSGDEQN